MAKKSAPRVCGNCAFWDTETFNPGEVLMNPHNPAEKHKEFACRWFPALIYKMAEEWCGQHQFKT